MADMPDFASLPSILRFMSSLTMSFELENSQYSQIGPRVHPICKLTIVS